MSINFMSVIFSVLMCTMSIAKARMQTGTAKNVPASNLQSSTGSVNWHLAEDQGNGDGHVHGDGLKTRDSGTTLSSRLH